MNSPEQVLFLPGASGNVDFWRPAAASMQLEGRIVRHVGWPGIGPTPVDPAIRTLPDLAERIVAMLDRPTALVAQSMGGVVALLAALACPRRVTHLALAALSGGFDLARFGASDWRPPREERRAVPEHLFVNDEADLSAEFRSLNMPILLMFGDKDPISPPSAGAWLRHQLPRAQLHVLPGASHTFAMETHATQVSELIDRFLSGTTAEAMGMDP